MPSPPFRGQAAAEALGSTVPSLLAALAKEYERLQDENAILVARIATIGEHASSLPHHEMLQQDLPDSLERMTKQTSPTSVGELSQVSADKTSVDQHLSSNQQLSAEQHLSVHGERGPRELTAGTSSKVLKFEMVSHWKEHTKLIHETVPLPLRPASTQDVNEGSMSERFDKLEQVGSNGLAIHPDSKGRHLWVLGCILLLLLDVIWAPLDVGFNMGETIASKIMHYISMIYWTLDIPITFLTGMVLATHVEMRLRHIARIYARTWLCFDILILIPDYVEVVALKFPAAHVSVLRMLKWGRLMRLLRVARLSKLARLKLVLRSVVIQHNMSRFYNQVTSGLVGLMCLVLVCMHIQACFWHGFGAILEDGWIDANNLGSASVGRLYTVSLHWSYSRLIGSNSGYNLKTVTELAVDTFLMIVSLLVAASLLAHVAVMAIARRTSKPFSLWKSSIEYSIRHDLPVGLEMRLRKWLEVSDIGRVGEIAEEEQKLLCALPDSLRRDLLFETRVPCLAHKQFINDIVKINQGAVRHLCKEAITEVVMVPHEAVFHQGDAGVAMRFVCNGTFSYSYSRSEDIQKFCHLQQGRSISEAALWTKWQHIGRLIAVEDPKIMVIDHDLFALTVKHHRRTLVYAVRYAKHFVQKLNQQILDVHDLVEFQELNLQFLNDNVFDDSDEKHFIFISHYKVEAGTEATLMFDQLKGLLMNDPEHAANSLLRPVFIDSENLADLARLKAHVKQSAILLLLLTPGILSRPWCLIEIATAIKHSVSVVLVDIKRPGCSFQYPDDNFYADLLAGRTLEPDSVSLLESEGVTLQKLEKGLRRIFRKISMPFSPHRSEEIREAELHSILKRCNSEFSHSDMYSMT